MNSKVRRLCISNASVLLAGAALPDSALAHPPIARPLDLHALVKLAQFTTRKNTVFLLTHRAKLKSDLSGARRIIANNDRQLQEQIQAINQQIADRSSKSHKAHISLFHTNARILLTQLHLIRKAERQTQLRTILESER